MTPDEEIKAIRWKLGIPVDPSNRRDDWYQLSLSTKQRDKLKYVAGELTRRFERAILRRLEVASDQSTHQKEDQALRALVSYLQQWITDDEVSRSHIVKNWIMTGLYSRFQARVSLDRTLVGTKPTSSDEIEAILRKLRIPLDKSNRAEPRHPVNLSSEQRDKLHYVGREVAHRFETAILIQFELLPVQSTNQKEQEALKALLSYFQKWVKDDEMNRSPLVTNWIVAGIYSGVEAAVRQERDRKLLSTKKAENSTTSPSRSSRWFSFGRPDSKQDQSPGVGATPTAPRQGPQPIKEPPAEQPPPRAKLLVTGPATVRTVEMPIEDGISGHVDSKDSGMTDPKGKAAESDSPLSKPAPPPSSLWKYLKVPDGPDKHDEFVQMSGQSPGIEIIGARVRGKKHKHDGSNCDDWFEVRLGDPWTVVAVSDGAGSKRLSRVGARVASRAAVEYLQSQLKGIRVPDQVDDARDQTGWFIDPNLKSLQQHLYAAMSDAHKAIGDALVERTEKPEYEETVGHKPLLNDFAATLLLTVHGLVGGKNSLIMTCQVGDGITSLIDARGALRLLGLPDSGKFSGETEFVTDKEQLAPDMLFSKTFVYCGAMRALMSCSDGVADPYFPNNPGMLNVYADLVLNKILETDASPADLSLPEIPVRSFSSKVETVAETPVEVHIRSSSEYAKLRELSIEEVVASPGLLAAGSTGEPDMCEETRSEDRLRVWLDSFYVRGEFDDRSLVVLYRTGLREEELK